MLTRNNMKKIVGLSMLILAVTFMGCNDDSDDEVLQNIEEAKSNVERAQPNLSDAELGQFVAGNNDFAVRMYHELIGVSQDKNVVFSPYSISADLGMVYAGAEGQTEDEMASTLGFTLPEEKIHEGFDALDLRYTADASGFTLHVANAVWGQTGWNFLQSFLDTLAKYYGAGVKLIDFGADPEAARNTINDWVEAQTNGRIKDLLPKGSISEATIMVLVNAIYFYADWLNKFDKDNTMDAVFHAPNADVTVPFMNSDFAVDYVRGDGYEAVRLPYVNEEFSMLLVLPDATRFSEIEDSLDATFIDGLAQSMTDTAQVSLPKFEFTFGLLLNDALIDLGMVSAFTGDADFSGIDGEKDLFISKVVHKAFIKVDEEGTEAAAATGTVVDYGSAAPNLARFDHPFIFILRDDATGQILFMGRVMDPSVN